MSRVTVTIDTDNDAFSDGDELPRLLNEAAIRIADGELLRRDSFKLFDVNGNSVGIVTVR